MRKEICSHIQWDPGCWHVYGTGPANMGRRQKGEVRDLGIGSNSGDTPDRWNRESRQLQPERWSSLSIQWRSTCTLIIITGAPNPTSQVDCCWRPQFLRSPCSLLYLLPTPSSLVENTCQRPVSPKTPKLLETDAKRLKNVTKHTYIAKVYFISWVDKK